MADVTRIQGPGGANEPQGKKPVTEAEKFKELMRVQKTPESDPEEKKKRKRREEAEEEDADNLAPPPPGLTPSASVEQTASPLEIQKVGPPKMGAEAPPSQSQAASQEETPTPPPSTQATAPQAPVAPSKEGVSMTDAPQIESPKAIPDETKTSAQKPKEAILPGSAKSQEGKIAAQAPGTQKAEEKEKFFEEFGKKIDETSPQVQKREEEAAEIAGAAGVPLAAKEAAGAVSKEDKDKKIEEISTVAGGATPTGLPTAPDILPAAPITPPAYTQLNPQLNEIFERMVSSITVIQSAGLQETTINLTSDKFAGSVFYGSQIIIQEFSTAPLSYNVQFVSTPEGAALFQANIADLTAAIQSERYNFKFNRIETGLLTERPPLVRRKEGPGGETGQGKGGQK